MAHLGVPSKRGRMLPALAGALVLAVLVPCVIIWLCDGGDPRFQTAPYNPGDFIASRFRTIECLLSLCVYATIFCGPFTASLGFGLYWLLVGSDRARKNEERDILLIGALSGCFIGYLNLPIFAAASFLNGKGWEAPQEAMLFVVSGATCGAWIAWQAFREVQPGRGFLPRFSLRTLILLVLAWGALLALLLPR